MKKYIAGVTALVLMASMIPMVSADQPTQVISVTLTPGGTLSITCNRTAWDGEGAGLGETGTTTPTDSWGKITNTGTLRADITVKVNDTDDWTVESSAGLDQFEFYINISGSGESQFTDGGTPITFVDDLDKDQVKNFGLRVVMPTSSSTNNAQTTELTFTATVG